VAKGRAGRASWIPQRVLRRVGGDGWVEETPANAASSTAAWRCRSVAIPGQESAEMNVSNSWLGGSIRLCAVAALAMLAADAVAQNYSVKINPTLHDLDIKIEPVATTGMLVVKLTNKTDTKVRCDLRYDASPQVPYRKTTYVDPGKTEQSVFRAKQKWFSVDVNVECKSVEK
jgi:hypothetical protein